MLCPDISLIKEYYKIRNNYGSENRISISYEIIECNSDFNDECKSSEEIRSFAPNVFITMYIIEE